MKQSFKTSIGGQAVIEGVMMRGPETTALAVRKPDGEISLDRWKTPPMSAWYRKTPFIRGAFNMVSSLLIGYQCLMKSASLAGFEEEQPSKFERWLSQKLGKSMSAVVAVVALMMGVVLAIGLFTVLPTIITGSLARFLTDPPVLALALIEGVIKIAIFVAYLALVSRMPDIRRVFEYHGAEHKTIFCYESGLPLTVENVRKQPRFHPRCGTNFILIVLVISVLLFSMLSWENAVLRVALKIALLPVVVGVAYEIIKLAGRHNNAITRIVCAPGLWLQRLTTNEPDDKQIEVAIAAMEPAIPEAADSDRW